MATAAGGVVSSQEGGYRDPDEGIQAPTDIQGREGARGANDGQSEVGRGHQDRERSLRSEDRDTARREKTGDAAQSHATQVGKRGGAVLTRPHPGPGG